MMKDKRPRLRWTMLVLILLSLFGFMTILIVPVDVLNDDGTVQSVIALVKSEVPQLGFIDDLKHLGLAKEKMTYLYGFFWLIFPLVTSVFGILSRMESLPRILKNQSKVIKYSIITMWGATISAIVITFLLRFKYGSVVSSNIIDSIYGNYGIAILACILCQILHLYLVAFTMLYLTKDGRKELDKV